MKVIIMPYFELGSIGFYSWTNENIKLLRTCIKHAILTYISAFFLGYLHGDFHPGNVLLKKTKQTSISYLFDDIGEISNIETNGIRPWIMDFENTREINKNNNADLLDFYFDIQKFFILLQDHRFIRNIDKTSTVPLLQIINHYINHFLYPDLNFIHKVLHYIENISLLHP
jgi:predicted unusual protein kinase regulating ubiquinone biosynthesis (AarF/ABC1/UbiB family)